MSELDTLNSLGIAEHLRVSTRYLGLEVAIKEIFNSTEYDGKHAVMYAIETALKATTTVDKYFRRECTLMK